MTKDQKRPSTTPMMLQRMLAIAAVGTQAAVGVAGSMRGLQTVAMASAAASTIAAGADIVHMPHGADAVTELLSGGNASRLERLAKRMNVTADAMKHVLEEDDTLFLDSSTLDAAEGPEIFFVAAHLPHPNITAQYCAKYQNITGHYCAYRSISHTVYRAKNSPRRLRRGKDDVWKLHSNPGASKILYLDFDGHDLTGTAWSRHTPLIAPPCDWDGNPSSFSDVEKGHIESIWSSVAEDFAPFDVDVTTELQSEDQITRSSRSDAHYGNRVLIAPGIASICGSSCGGTSYVGIYARSGAMSIGAHVCAHDGICLHEHA